jgi:hypothetical protein
LLYCAQVIAYALKGIYSLKIELNRK